MRTKLDCCYQQAAYAVMGTVLAKPIRLARVWFQRVHVPDYRSEQWVGDTKLIDDTAAPHIADAVKRSGEHRPWIERVANHLEKYGSITGQQVHALR